MCEVSDKLKLCSCKTENVENLKHYWVLNRPINRGDRTLGTLLPPADIGEYFEKLNINSLRKHLNDGNCFDIELTHQENDILELHFTCKGNTLPDQSTSYDGNLVYAFSYKKGKWRKTAYDAFGNNMYNVQVGKISTPFNRFDLKSDPPKI
jgi:hypothetical protein